MSRLKAALQREHRSRLAVHTPRNTQLLALTFRGDKTAKVKFIYKNPKSCNFWFKYCNSSVGTLTCKTTLSLPSKCLIGLQHYPNRTDHFYWKNEPSETSTWSACVVFSNCDHTIFLRRIILNFVFNISVLKMYLSERRLKPKYSFIIRDQQI